jgi:hypothetical protein
MPSSSDLDINRAIRRIMVKHWVDLGRISIRTTGGRVLMRGLLRRIEGCAQADFTSATVEAMFYEISRIKGIQRVTAHFENWLSEGGRWKLTEPKGQSFIYSAENKNAP